MYCFRGVGSGAARHGGGAGPGMTLWTSNASDTGKGCDDWRGKVHMRILALKAQQSYDQAAHRLECRSRWFTRDVNMDVFSERARHERDEVTPEKMSREPFR